LSKDERGATIVDRKIGQRVRTRRLEIGMSQERLAELLGVTFQQVQKYEKGINRIAASRLLDIANALDKSVASFYEGLGNQGKTGATDEVVPETAEEIELLVLSRKLSRVSVKRLLELLQSLGKK